MFVLLICNISLTEAQCMLWKLIHVSWYIVSISPLTFLCIKCIGCGYITDFIQCLRCGSIICIFRVLHYWAWTLIFILYTLFWSKNLNLPLWAEGEMAGCAPRFWSLRNGERTFHITCASQLSIGWDVVSELSNVDTYKWLKVKNNSTLPLTWTFWPRVKASNWKMISENGVK